MYAIRVSTSSALRHIPNGFAPLRRYPHKSALFSTSASAITVPAAPSYRNLALGVGGGCLLAGLHSATGSANDFYDYRWITKKHPDDLASFYGGEELMELFCVFPIVGKIMMRNATFDETGNVITSGVLPPGSKLKVNMVFSDEVDDNTGETDWFNKRERFRNSFMGYTMYDMVLNFGFRTLDDGTRECYHFGEYFHGYLPIVSQIMLAVFKVHARWVAWATEHHINHYAFVSNDNEEEEEMEEQSRANMPLFLLKNYAWSDLMSMLFGYDEKTEKQPSFLIVDKNSSSDEHVDQKLPFQQEAIQLQIREDIKSDKEVMKDLLNEESASSADDVKAILVRRHTLNLQRRRESMGRKGTYKDDAEQPKMNDDKTVPDPNYVYILAKDLAMDRAIVRRLTRQKTRSADIMKEDNQ